MTYNRDAQNWALEALHAEALLLYLEANEENERRETPDFRRSNILLESELILRDGNIWFENANTEPKEPMRATQYTDKAKSQELTRTLETASIYDYDLTKNVYLEPVCWWSVR